MIRNVLNILCKYTNDFWHKIKMYNLDTYNVLLAISINIPAAYGCFVSQIDEITQ